MFHDEFVERERSAPSIQRPHTLFFYPVFRELGNRESAIVGLLAGQIAFDVYMADLLPDGVEGIVAVFNNSCGEAHMYQVTSNKAIYIGYGDSHDRKFDSKAVDIEFSDYFDHALATSTDGHCYYKIILYPTDALAAQYESYVPTVFTSIVAGTFAMMIVTFFIYDRIVDRRNDKVVDAALRASNIVSSLFPSNVRDRIYAQAGANHGNQTRLKSFLSEPTYPLSNESNCYWA